MDILRVPTPEEKIIAKIGKWIKSSSYDKNQNVNVTFKKDTPKAILKLFQNNTDLFTAITDHNVNPKYLIEK